MSLPFCGGMGVCFIHDKCNADIRPAKGETPKIPQAHTQKNNTMETKHREDTPGIGSDNTKSLNPALKPVHQERAKHASLNGAET